jgi:hypothetical protein
LVEEEMAATDFLTVEVWAPVGLVRYRVLFVMRLMTLEIHFAGMVPEPCETWMLQTARNLTDACNFFLRGMRFLIHDRSTLCTARFREISRASAWTRFDFRRDLPIRTLSPKGSFGASKNPALSESSSSGNPRCVARFLNLLCIITPSETTKVWRTASFNRNSPNSPRKAWFIPARDSVAFCSTMIEKPHEFASYESGETGNQAADALHFSLPAVVNARMNMTALEC